jgi:hypothetical protein
MRRRRRQPRRTFRKTCSWVNPDAVFSPLMTDNH